MKIAVLCFLGIFSLLFPSLNAVPKNPFNILGGYYGNQKPSTNQNDDEPVYNYTVAWYLRMPIDHLHGSTKRTFKLRYFYNFDNYKPGGPLFFYTGNEGNLEAFANNTGIIWDLGMSIFEISNNFQSLAPKFNAAIVFAEHRYYGYSYPFGNLSFTDIKYLRYLDTEQVLADYVVLISHVKRSLINDTDAKVIAFGGSYGGMLTAWFRVKYPDVTVGGWASSAPIIYFKDGGVPVDGFSHITKTTFVSSGCDPDKIPDGYKAVERLARTHEGRKTINKIFKLDKNSCLHSHSDYPAVIGYVSGSFDYMAMSDYPYPTSFLQLLPAWPVEKSCKGVMATDDSDQGLVQGLYSIADVWYNGTGELNETCLKNCPNGHNPFESLGNLTGWTWQTCTQIIIEMCDSGSPNDFNRKTCNASNVFQGIVSGCSNAYSDIGWTVDHINENYVKDTFGFSYKEVTNLVATSGTYDPWYAGCLKRKLFDFQTSYKRGLYVFELEGSAHHLDLRQPNTCDPENIANVRFQITNILWCWAYPNDAKCNRINSKPDDLPPFVKKTVECKPIFNGYPWGH